MTLLFLISYLEKYGNNDFINFLVRNKLFDSFYFEFSLIVLMFTKKVPDKFLVFFNYEKYWQILLKKYKKKKYRLSLGKAVNFTDINNAPFCLNKLHFP